MTNENTRPSHGLLVKAYARNEDFGYAIIKIEDGSHVQPEVRVSGYKATYENVNLLGVVVALNWAANNGYPHNVYSIGKAYFIGKDLDGIIPPTLHPSVYELMLRVRLFPKIEQSFKVNVWMYSWGDPKKIGTEVGRRNSKGGFDNQLITPEILRMVNQCRLGHVMKVISPRHPSYYKSEESEGGKQNKVVDPLLEQIEKFNDSTSEICYSLFANLPIQGAIKGLLNVRRLVEDKNYNNELGKELAVVDHLMWFLNSLDQTDVENIIDRLGWQCGHGDLAEFDIRHIEYYEDEDGKTQLRDGGFNRG